MKTSRITIHTALRSYRNISVQCSNFFFLAQNNVEKKMTNTKARKKQYTRIQGGILCKANETLHNDELWEYRAR